MQYGINDTAGLAPIRHELTFVYFRYTYFFPLCFNPTRLLISRPSKARPQGAQQEYTRPFFSGSAASPFLHLQILLLLLVLVSPHPPPPSLQTPRLGFNWLLLHHRLQRLFTHPTDQRHLRTTTLALFPHTITFCNPTICSTKPSAYNSTAVNSTSSAHP